MAAMGLPTGLRCPALPASTPSRNASSQKRVHFAPVCVADSTHFAPTIDCRTPRPVTTPEFEATDLAGFRTRCARLAVSADQ